MSSKYRETKIKHPRSVVDQSAAQAMDLNRIVKQTRVTGLPPSDRQPLFTRADFGMDYHEAQNKILNVKLRFNALPARLRAEFDNDPKLLIDFISKPENQDLAIAKGLLPPKPLSSAVRAKQARQARVSEQVDLEEAIEEERSQRGRRAPKKE